MKTYRQGDVLVVAVSEIPPEAIPQAGRVILAHGEVTGHCHEIVSRTAKLFAKSEELFLALSQSEALTHQEHGSIEIPAGKYLVIRQREYAPQAIRNVAD